MNKEIKSDYKMILSIFIVCIVAAVILQISSGYGTSDYWVWEILIAFSAQILAIRRSTSKVSSTYKIEYIDFLLLAICFFGFLSFNGYLIRIGGYSLATTLASRFLIIVSLYNLTRIATIVHNKTLYLVGTLVLQWIYIYFITIRWSKYLNEDYVYGATAGSLFEKIYSLGVSYSCVPRQQVFLIGSLILITANILTMLFINRKKVVR